MIHQFDAHWSEPRFWIEAAAGSTRLSSKYKVLPSELDYRKPRLAFRGISAATNERTLIATMLPPYVFSEGRTATTVVQQNIKVDEQLFVLSCFNSFVLDWTLRAKVISNINMFYMYQLPLPRLTTGDPIFDAIVPRAARLTCTTPAFAELWQQVSGAEWSPADGAVDPSERAALRRELDALVAHLYGLSRDEFEHILHTFPLVFPPGESGEGLRERQLAVFEQMASEFAR